MSADDLPGRNYSAVPNPAALRGRERDVRTGRRVRDRDDKERDDTGRSDRRPRNPRVLRSAVVAGVVVVVVAAAITAAALVQSGDDDTTAVDTGQNTETTGVAGTGDPSEIDPELCRALREQAQGALALGTDPDVAFGVRDLVDGRAFRGLFPVNAINAVPQDVRSAQDALERGVNEVLPALDAAVVTGGDASGDVAAFHAAHNPDARTVLAFVDAAC